MMQKTDQVPEMGLSVIVLAYNSETYVRRALRSVSGIGDELIVCVDDKTTDRTFEIVKKFTDKVFHIHFENFGQFRNDAIKLARYKWIFMLDDDETLTHEDADKLIEFCADVDKTDVDAVLFPRRQWADLEMRRSMQPYPDWQCRLFRNNGEINCKDSVIHAGVKGYVNPKQCRDIHIQHFHIALHPYNSQWQAERDALYDAITRKYLDKSYDEVKHNLAVRTVPFQDTPPLASIIYPIKNRAHLFKYALSNLSQSASYNKIELVVVDQSSTDGLMDLLSQYSFYFPIKYFNVDIKKYTKYPLPDKPYCCPAYFLNLGIRNSSGEYVCLTSPEIWPQFDIIAELEEHYKEDPNMAYLSLAHQGVWFEGRYIPTRQRYGPGCGLQMLAGYYFFGAYPRKHVLSFNGIEEEYMSGLAVEDDDFGDTYTANGYKFAIFKNGEVWHLEHEATPWYHTPENFKNIELQKRRREQFGLDKPRKNNIRLHDEWGSNECVIDSRLLWLGHVFDATQEKPTS